MSWQDLVLAVGGFVIAAGIIPTITGPVKPALTTSATIFVGLGVSTVAFASLGLSVRAAGAAIQFVALRLSVSAPMPGSGGSLERPRHPSASARKGTRPVFFPDAGVTPELAAAPDLLERLTGYKVGGISPFGQMRTVRTAVEAGAMAHDAVYMNGGRRGLQVRLAPKDAGAALEAIVAPLVA